MIFTIGRHKKSLLIVSIALLVLIFIYLYFSTVVFNDYMSGRDTVVSFGDGRYQILRFPNGIPKQLIDLSIKSPIDETIEINVKGYREIPPMVYIIGEKQYTIINYKTFSTKQTSSFEELSENEKNIFSEENSFTKFD